MYDKVINPVTKLIASVKNYKTGTDEYEILKYKVSVQVYDLWKYAVLFLISLYLGITVEVGVLVLSMAFIRTTSFGFHLKNGLYCLMLGLAMFLIPAFALNGVNISLILTCLIFGLSFLAFSKYAPGATEKRPISKREAVLYKRKVLIKTVLLFAIVLAFGGFVGSMITCGVAICAINILPITYRLFKCEICDYTEDIPTIENIKPTTLNMGMQKANSIIIEKGSRLQCFISANFTSRQAKYIVTAIVCTVGLCLALSQNAYACAPPSWFEEPDLPNCLKNNKRRGV